MNLKHYSRRCVTYGKVRDVNRKSGIIAKGTVEGTQPRPAQSVAVHWLTVHKLQTWLNWYFYYGPDKDADKRAGNNDPFEGEEVPDLVRGNK